MSDIDLNEEVEWLGIKMTRARAIHAEHMDNPIGRLAPIFGLPIEYTEPDPTMGVTKCPVCDREL